MGCDKLTVATDHKPLVKIYGDRTLDEIQNTRLFRLKQRALSWYFGTIHVPGKTNLAPDATSRHPAPTEEDDLNDHLMSEFVVAAATRNDAEKLTSITWDDLASETLKDANLASVHEAVLAGFPEVFRTNPITSPYWQYRDSLYITDGVIVYSDRVVVPQSLRHAVLDALHAAHQGVYTMSLRARSIVFWPGMTNDIERRRLSCAECIKNAPSQPSLPNNITWWLVIVYLVGLMSSKLQKAHHKQDLKDSLRVSATTFYALEFPKKCQVMVAPNSHLDQLRTFCIDGASVTDSPPPHTIHNQMAVLKSQSNQQRGFFVQAQGHQEHWTPIVSPDHDCQLSPAEIVFGRPLRDAFAFINRLEKFSNNHIRPMWREAWQRFHQSAEERNLKSRCLPSFHVGDRCYIQNQTENNPKRWDRSGTIVELHGHDSYTVKVDGTGRLTRRNRRYLCQFKPASIEITNQNKHISPTLPYLPMKNQGKPPQHQDASLPLDPAPVLVVQPQTNDPQPTVTEFDTSSGSVAPLPAEVNPTYSSTLQVPPVGDNRQANNDTDVSVPSPRRSQRTSKAPRKYVPETGQWN